MAEYNIEPRHLLEIRAALETCPPGEEIGRARYRLLLRAAASQVPEAILIIVYDTFDDPSWLDDHPKIRNHFRMLISHNHPEALYIQGLIHHHEKEYERALNRFRDALRAVETMHQEVATQKPIIFGPELSFPGKVVFAMAAAYNLAGNQQTAVEHLSIAANNYDDPDANRVLGRQKREMGDFLGGTQLLKKAASLSDAESALMLAIDHWLLKRNYHSSAYAISRARSDSQSEDLKAALLLQAQTKYRLRMENAIDDGTQLRSMARYWLETYLYHKPNQGAIKILLATYKQTEPTTQTAKEEGYAAVKTVEQEYSGPSESMSKRATKEQIRAHADFRKSWRDVAGHLLSRWWSPGFRAVDFQWPVAFHHYLPSDSPWYDLVGAKRRSRKRS